MTSEYERGHAAGIRDVLEILDDEGSIGNSRRRILALLDAPAPAGVTVKPLVWGYHPAGTIAAPPTGHAYIIDTRMKGRVYSVKGFKPEREFGSLDEAKAAAQTDYEARIMAALEPAPAGVTVQEAAKVLQELVTCVEDGCYCSEMKMAAAVDEANRLLRAISEGRTNG